jgi:hypothetical protein
VRRYARGNTSWLDQQSRLSVLTPPEEIYLDSSDTTAATNDVILRLETPRLRALLRGAANDLALDALAGPGQSLAADVVAVALPPGRPIDSQGLLGAVLKMARPRLIVASTLAPDDEEAASALYTLITWVCASGAIELRGDANGWTLGA